MIAPPHPLRGRNLRRRAAAVDSGRSSLDEVEPALDLRNVPSHPVDPAGNIGVLCLDQTEPLFDLDQIGLYLGNVAPNGAEMFED
jgi:hypothetical protein